MMPGICNVEGIIYCSGFFKVVGWRRLRFNRGIGAMRIGILGCLFLLLCAFSSYSSSAEPEVVTLWVSDVPGAVGTEKKDTPRLILYPAKENPSGTAVVICPGGGLSLIHI